MVLKTINSRSGVILVVAALLAAVCMQSALAAPTSVDPAQVEKRFEDTSGIKAAPSVTVVPADSKQPSAQARAALAQKRFTLKQVNVEGSTVFSSDELASAYSDMLGKNISMLDAYTIAKRITDKYRARGYVLSQAKVASQDVSGGTLKLRVSEGYISNVVIQGETVQSDYRKVLDAYVDHIKSIKPVKTTDVERYLLLMDDLAGVTAKGLVRASSTKPGAADLIVTLVQKPFEGSYTVDNRGSKFIGPFQHTGIVVANSLFGMYDRTVLRGITTSPTEELRFFDIFHELPVDSDGTKAGFIASISHTEPGDSLKSSNIEGDSHFVQARLSHPFLRARRENLSGRVLFDVRNTDIDTNNVNTSNDRLRVVRVGGNYDFTDTFSGANLLDAEISQGLNIFNASNAGSLRSRSDGKSNFTKINMDIARTQYLPLNGVTLFTVATGQYAADRLLAAEQQSVGGASYGRGYEPSEISGDHAVAAKAELRYTQAVSDPLVKTYQLYGFYDIGRTWLRSTVNGDNSLASTGTGIRVNFTNTLSSNLEVAVPLTKDVSNQGNHGDSPRLFFGATASF